MSNATEVRLDEDRLETIKCGNWDVAGDLFTVNARTEVEKRLQMSYFLKRNKSKLSTFSVQHGGRIISGIWAFYSSSPLSSQCGNDIPGC